jgi:hypothetical protein
MRNILLVMLLIVFGSSKCVMDEDIVPIYDAFFVIENNSDEDILYVLSYSNDTLLEEFSFLRDNKQMELATIFAYNKSKEIGCDKEFLSNGGIYHLFLFGKQTVIELPWDTIVANKLILKRSDLTLTELENQNWTITYP